MLKSIEMNNSPFLPFYGPMSGWKYVACDHRGIPFLVDLQNKDLTAPLPKELLGWKYCIIQTTSNPNLECDQEPPIAQRRILESVFEDVGGCNWVYKNNWCNEEQPISTWRGVSVLGGNVNCIDSLELNVSLSHPTLIPLLGQLPSLTQLVVSWESTPSSLHPISHSLLYLHACASQRIPLPPQIGQLTNLRSLNLKVMFC